MNVRGTKSWNVTVSTGLIRSVVMVVLLGFAHLSRVYCIGFRRGAQVQVLFRFAGGHALHGAAAGQHPQLLEDELPGVSGQPALNQQALVVQTNPVEMP